MLRSLTKSCSTENIASSLPVPTRYRLDLNFLAQLKVSSF